MVLTATATDRDRLIEYATQACERTLEKEASARLSAVSMADPTAVADAVGACLPGRVRIVGTAERRLVVAERSRGSGGWLLGDLSGQPHASRVWPPWVSGHIRIHEPGSWLSSAELTAAAVERLSRPRLLLAALYHPEWFPLPRFPLGISDVARAARSTLLGQVRLMDMQLGVQVEDIVRAAGAWEADIVGISATFGQHDLMVEALEELQALPTPPLVIVGGSLSARNEKTLLASHPHVVVARGPGEPTIEGLLRWFHRDIPLQKVPGLSFIPGQHLAGASDEACRTPVVRGAAWEAISPELDLLDATLAHHGVAQLEASRGCTNFCSFCPRGHKGAWTGGAAEQISRVLQPVSDVFDRHPEVSRTLYLVDEEFIGRGPAAVARALSIAEAVHDAGFRWESSCRVDQVADPARDLSWHTERAAMWRRLVGVGLRRMLFGVESGVSSVLERFNKETTAEQNALAIRTLSALGVPTRFTYITFDQLMTPDELCATHAFQARTDLLLRPLPELSPEEIVRGVRDDSFVAEHAVGEPFYRGISYLLVSMECLIGAAYTRRVQAAGLGGGADPTMGRIHAAFADPRIGELSRSGQLWIDRNFAFDYTLKSLEKVIDGPPRFRVRQARAALKDAAFHLLTDMVPLLKAPTIDTDLREALTAMRDAEFAWLVSQMEGVLPPVLAALPPAKAELLRREHARWMLQGQWRLINAGDACGT